LRRIRPAPATGGAAAEPELQEANELGDTEGSEDGRMDEQTDEQEDTDDGVPDRGDGRSDREG
jgi:hypothetical protein